MAFGITVDDFLDVNFFKCASDKSHPTQKCMYVNLKKRQTKRGKSTRRFVPLFVGFICLFRFFI